MTPPTSSPITERLLRWADRWRWGLLAVVVAVYVAAFNGQWRPGPDSAEHLVVAQRLLHGQGFTHPTGWENQLAPGLAYLVAAISYPFGSVQLLACQVAMLVIALGTLALAFALLREAFGRPTAVLLTVMLALTETYFRLSTDLLTDMPFCLGLILMLLGWQRLFPQHGKLKHSTVQIADWLMLAAGVAVMALFRSVVVTVLMGVAVYVLWRMVRGPRRWRVAAASAVMLGAWGLAHLLHPGSMATDLLAHDESRAVERVIFELPQTLARLISDNLPRLLTENTAEALLGVDFGPAPSVLLVVVIVAGWWRLMRTHALWGLITAAFFLQWLLIMPGDRYFLPVLLPLLVGWWQCALWLEKRWPGGAGRIAVATMLLLWVVPNVVRVADVVHDQHRTPFLAQFDGGRYQMLQAMGKAIAEICDDHDLVISTDGQVLTWYSGRAVMDPKQLRLSVGLDKWQLGAQLRGYRRLFLVRPIDPGQKWFIQRLPLEYGRTIVTVSMTGRKQPFTLQEVKLLDRFRSLAAQHRAKEGKASPSALEP